MNENKKSEESLRQNKNKKFDKVEVKLSDPEKKNYSNFEGGDKKSPFRVALFLLVIFILGVIALIFFVFSFHEVVSESPKCGDGTFENYCSITKPYQCVNQTLIKNIPSCGCPDFFHFYNSSCISDYGSAKNEAVLKYFLNGNEYEIPFLVYPGVSDYLSNLSRTITYSKGETPRRDDFAFKKIDEPVQKDYLMPLVVEIQNLAPDSKDTQAKIAVSLVQNIPYNSTSLVNSALSNFGVGLSRYPYQVVAENAGACEGKSELLAFLLREMDFGVVLFYYPEENHEAVGIKCPIEKSYLRTGYCFVETTQPSPISFSSGEYLMSSGVGQLFSEPEIIFLGDGFSLSGDLEDYSDAEKLAKTLDKLKTAQTLNLAEELVFNGLKQKYSLND